MTETKKFLYALADAIDLLTGVDNDLNDGVEPNAKIVLTPHNATEVEIMFTPVDGKGGYDDDKAEVFIAEFRRADVMDYDV